MYIDELNNRTFDKNFLDWSDAYKSTKEGKLWGYLDIGRNFTQATTNKFFFQPANGSNINLYLDSSNQQITYLIQARVAEAYQNFLIKFIESLKLPIDPSLLQSPIIMQEPIYGEKDPQFISFMAPGIMITIIFTVTIGLTALMFVIEKKEGLLERCFTAGVSTIEIMSAHVAVKLFILIVQITFLMLITNFAFNVIFFLFFFLFKDKKI